MCMCLCCINTYIRNGQAKHLYILYLCNRLCSVFILMGSCLLPLKSQCPVLREGVPRLPLSQWHKSQNGGREDHGLEIKLKCCEKYLEVVDIRERKVKEDSEESWSHLSVSTFPFPFLLVSLVIVQYSSQKSQALLEKWRTISCTWSTSDFLYGWLTL